MKYQVQKIGFNFEAYKHSDTHTYTQAHTHTPHALSLPININTTFELCSTLTNQIARL